MLPLSVLVQADWASPSVAPAALVLLAAYCALAVRRRRQVAAAARWIAVPVGPARPVPWLGGRRLLALLLVYVLVVVAIVL